MRQVVMTSTELAQAIVQAEIDFTSSRIASIAERAGNPEGACISAFGQAIAYYVKTMPWEVFNCVKGLTDTDVDELDRLLAFYGERDRSPAIEIDPPSVSRTLLRDLAQHGYYQSRFHSVLYRQLDEEVLLELGAGQTIRQRFESVDNLKKPVIHIEEIKTEESFQLFAATHCVSSGMDPVHTPHFARNNHGLLGRSGWQLYLAYLEDEPAGVAMMHIQDKVASCTLAATLPSARGRGIHTALIHRRMTDAVAAGCTLMTAQASFGSVSQRNMERMGMRLAWTRAVWTADV